MNIGIVTTWFERGAAYVSRQYRKALEREHPCFIYARGGERYAKGDANWDDSRVWWGKPGLAPAPTSIDLPDFERWIRANRLDAVWFNEQRWWEPVLLCNRMGVKTGGFMVVFSEDEIPLHGCFDFLTCNSHHYHDLLRWHPQAWFIPWGTELSVFRPQQYAPVRPGCVTFFHSAGMNPRRKGTDQLIRAFRRVDGARLVIHSQVELKPHLASEWESVQELERRDLVTLRIETVAAPGLFHLGDVYVYPMRLDSLGLTVPEALACGLPVIAPDNAPMNEFIDGACGRIVRVARYYSRSDGHYWPNCLVDEDDLAAQMQWYVDHISEVEERKRAARCYAEQNLNWDENARELPNLFAGARKLSASENGKYLAAAHAFEVQRAHQTPRAWLSHYCPWAIRYPRAMYRFFTRR